MMVIEWALIIGAVLILHTLIALAPAPYVAVRMYQEHQRSKQIVRDAHERIERIRDAASD